METVHESIADRVYCAVKDMAITYHIRPGERVNEVELSRLLGVSRTPLREALGRLNTEGVLRFVAGKGYYNQDLNPKDIFDLYELRKTLETSAVRLSSSRARDQDIRSLLDFIEAGAVGASERSTRELVASDQEFHERLMRLSENEQMMAVLNNINARIHFVRGIDMKRLDRTVTINEHRQVVEALLARDAARCSELLEAHIDRGRDQIRGAIKEGYAEIYMQGM